MELTIALALSILGSVISVLSLIFNRKDKSNKDVANEQYKFGKLDEQLKNIFQKLDKIDAKLDTFDKEIDEKIEKAIKQHEIIYHSSKQ